MSASVGVAGVSAFLPSAGVPATIEAFTKGEEGGYSAVRADSGNWSTGLCGHGEFIGSNLGIGAPAAISWMHPNERVVTSAWMKGTGCAGIWLPLANARYWRPLACPSMPQGLAVMVFDYGWNRGIANSGRQLQEALEMPESEWDGDVGPETLRALAGVKDLAALVNRLADVQVEHYRVLGNFGTFGKGWLARTARRQALGLSMLEESAG